MTMGAAPTATPVARIRVAEPSLRHDLRAVKIVLHREMLRFFDDKLRMGSQLFQPLLWLLVLGTGLASLMPAGAGGVDLKTFMFPGVIAMSVTFTGMFSAASIVWDREFGFLREMLVAPVSNTAIMLGKCLGGATVATSQSLVILAMAGLVGVPYDPVMMLKLLGLLFLMAFMVCAIGLVLAARTKQIQTAMPMVQLVITPMMFLSGALFPLAALPVWLAIITRLNPLTYAVEPMRSVVFDRLTLDEQSRAALDPGITWNGWHVPIAVQVALVVVLGVGLLALAVKRFARTE
jgi:ABC-2 type transport system permease protein